MTVSLQNIKKSTDLTKKGQITMNQKGCMAGCSSLPQYKLYNTSYEKKLWYFPTASWLTFLNQEIRYATTQILNWKTFDSIIDIWVYYSVTEQIQEKSHLFLYDVTGWPASSVTWLHDNAMKAMQSNDTFVSGYYTFSTGTLTIHSLDRSMDGKTAPCISTPVYRSPTRRNTALNVQC